MYIAIDGVAWLAEPLDCFTFLCLVARPDVSYRKETWMTGIYYQHGTTLYLCTDFDGTGKATKFYRVPMFYPES